MMNVHPHNNYPTLTFFLALSLLCGVCFSYNIESNSLTTSGLSAGGFAAVQFHVAFSASVKGAGILAGGPYWCANANLEIALNACMSKPNDIILDELIEATTFAASMFSIDPPSHLYNSKVWVYGAMNDTVVYPGVVQKLLEYYGHYVDNNNIATILNHTGEHAFPTINYGNSPCTFLGPNYINDCGYDAAGALLTHLYGKLLPPTTMISNNLIPISQEQYIPPPYTPLSASLDKTGYLYVPTNCAKNASQCKIHVAFHGCLQSVSVLGSDYVMNTGYNPWAEANNIIIVYPQVEANELNPKACFDWWGYTGEDYATQFAVQMVTIMGIVNSLSS